MNPYVILALVVAWGGSLLGTGWVAFGLGQDSEIASQAKTDKQVADTREAAQQGAADAISKIKITNTTIRQKAETVVRDNVRYVDCRHADGMRDTINEALTGQPKPAGGGELPKPDAAR